MRPPARLILSGAALFVVAACNNDASVAPSLSAPPNVAGSPALAALALGATVDFVIPASGGDINLLGMYTLHFPANAVCDPNAQDSQNGYASQSWDSPCTAAVADIPVHAILHWYQGRLSTDFTPAMRFVPGQVVTISTDVIAPVVQYYGQSAFSSGLARQWGIGYAPYLDGPGANDSKGDATLKTQVDPSTGHVWRRIKHFSGYFLTVGLTSEPCDPSGGNPNCIWYDTNPDTGDE
jgi:hypothetical protein